MPIRYVIRPSGIMTTPRALRDALGAERTVRYPGPSRRWLSINTDFFLAYPPQHMIWEFMDADLRVSATRRYAENSRYRMQLHGLCRYSLDQYSAVRGFFLATKPLQRFLLSELGFHTPRTFSSVSSAIEFARLSDPGSRRFVARPHRHSEGRDFRLIREDELPTINTTTHYISEFYPKAHEYRIIVCRGEPIITLLKRVPDEIPNTLPWNHAVGSSFVTVHDWNNNRLRHTDIYDVIGRNREFLTAIDLCGLDVMVNLRHAQPYVVTELNLCPAITIPANLERIKAHVSQVL